MRTTNPEQTDDWPDNGPLFLLTDNPAFADETWYDVRKTASLTPPPEATAPSVPTQPNADELCQRISAQVEGCAVCGLLDLQEAALLGLAHSGLPETVAAEADLLLIAHGRFLSESLQQLHRLADETAETQTPFQEVQAVFERHVLLGQMLEDGRRAVLLLLEKRQNLDAVWTPLRTALRAEGLLSAAIETTKEETAPQPQTVAELERRSTAPLPPVDRSAEKPPSSVVTPLGAVRSKLSYEAASAETYVPLPPLPGSQPDREVVSPASMAKTLLHEIRAKQPRLRRDWLGAVGQPEGSQAKSDSLVYQAGSWCLRTSLNRRFDTLAEADTALRSHLEVLALLEDLQPANTFFVLAPDESEHYWFWTVSPWLLTLEAELRQSVVQEDNVALAATLCKYAEAVVRALQLALRRNVLLNLAPSSFATTYAGGPLVYLDDELGWGTCIPGVAEAILARAEEHADQKKAVEVYLDMLGLGISKRFKRDDIHHLDLLRALRDVPVTSETMYLSQARLLEQIRKCPE